MSLSIPFFRCASASNAGNDSVDNHELTWGPCWVICRIRIRDRLERSTINRRAISSSKHAWHCSWGTRRNRRAGMVSKTAKLMQNAAKCYIIDLVPVGQCGKAFQSGGSLTQFLLIDLAIVYCTNSDFCLYNSSLSNTLLCMACICMPSKAAHRHRHGGWSLISRRQVTRTVSPMLVWMGCNFF